MYYDDGLNKIPLIQSVASQIGSVRIISVNSIPISPSRPAKKLLARIQVLNVIGELLETL